MIVATSAVALVFVGLVSLLAIYLVSERQGKNQRPGRVLSARKGDVDVAALLPLLAEGERKLDL